jgi:hypothetical protein
VDHWTSGTVYECSEIAGSPGFHPAADYVGCEAGRRTCSERETGTEELCEIKWAEVGIANFFFCPLIANPLIFFESAKR